MSAEKIIKGVKYKVLAQDGDKVRLGVEAKAGGYTEFWYDQTTGKKLTKKGKKYLPARGIIPGQSLRRSKKKAAPEEKPKRGAARGGQRRSQQQTVQFRYVTPAEERFSSILEQLTLAAMSKNKPAVDAARMSISQPLMFETYQAFTLAAVSSFVVEKIGVSQDYLDGMFGVIKAPPSVAADADAPPPASDEVPPPAT